MIILCGLLLTLSLALLVIKVNGTPSWKSRKKEIDDRYLENMESAYQRINLRRDRTHDSQS
jgi:hypothetical protein